MCVAGALLSIEEAAEQSENATVHFFCPQAHQAIAVEQAIRGATGIDLIVSCLPSLVMFQYEQ